jgi:hypothetical protein
LASVTDLTRIPIVGVDATHHTTVDGNAVLYDNIARPTIPFAVATTAHQLAVFLCEEVADNHGPAAVKLNNLIVGAESSAAVDVGGTAGLLQGQSVFADVSPPDVIERAEILRSAERTLTVCLVSYGAHTRFPGSGCPLLGPCR